MSRARKSASTLPKPPRAKDGLQMNPPPVPKQQRVQRSFDEELSLKAVIMKTLKLVATSHRIVVMSGAGISTSCGIPDFRSEDGVYSELAREHKSLNMKNEDFFDLAVLKAVDTRRVYYKFMANLKRKCDEAKPGPTHGMIATLARTGRLLSCLTQNIDGLEGRAGLQLGTQFVQLHGNLEQVSCKTQCQYKRDWTEQDTASFFLGIPPPCPECTGQNTSRPRARRGGFLSPHIVMYGEATDVDLEPYTKKGVNSPDLLLVMGTSINPNIPGFIHSLKAIADTVHNNGGNTIFINLTKPPRNVEEHFDYYVPMDTDKWSRQLQLGEPYPEFTVRGRPWVSGAFQTTDCASIDTLQRCYACRDAANDDDAEEDTEQSDDAYAEKPPLVCQFKGTRIIFKDEQSNRIVGQTLGTPQGITTNSPTKYTYPILWNIPFTSKHANQIKRAIAHSLLPILERELKHSQQAAGLNVVLREQDVGVRDFCDFCKTSLFSAGWMCRCCGREACISCYENSDNVLGAHRDACASSNEDDSQLFVPVIRFQTDELEIAVQEMKASLNDGHVPETTRSKQNPDSISSFSRSHTSRAKKDFNVVLSRVSEVTEWSTSRVIQHRDRDRLNAKGSHVSGVSPFAPHFLPKIYSAQEVTDESFDAICVESECLIVTGIRLSPELWSPSKIVEACGDEDVILTNCRNQDEQMIKPVSEYLITFGTYNERPENDCWKLKDYPPKKSFNERLRDQYNDFMENVPAPSYVRPDGVLNLTSHYPNEALKPDIGPKMYIAHAMMDDNFGSTPIHCDVSNALNVQLHSFTLQSDTTDQHGALWHLFHPDDSKHLRSFMRAKFNCAEDPIHLQKYYLNEEMLAELNDKFNIKSYRHVQLPGQGVFIPAGWAHQVRNLSDCIKVAIDFLPVGSLKQCQELTEEFRLHNLEKEWKTDILQLKVTLWFAWQSCCLWEKKWKGL